MAKDDPITQTAMRIPESLHMELKIAAIQQKTSVNAILLDLIKKYLADYKKKSKK